VPPNFLAALPGGMVGNPTSQSPKFLIAESPSGAISDSNDPVVSFAPKSKIFATSTNGRD
jgi:hypothetical protein